MDARTLPNLSLRGMKDAEAVHQSQVVYTNISAHAAFQHIWSPYAVQMDEYASGIANMRDAMVAAATHDTLKVAHCVACRKKLDSDYYYVGRYCELVTRNDPSILVALGYPVARSISKGKPPLAAPTSPSVKQGSVSGTVVARVDKLPGARSFEGQYTTGDPTVESNWGFRDAFGSWHDMVFANLIPGQLYSFRFRGIFAKGQGPWSVVVTLMAT